MVVSSASCVGVVFCKDTPAKLIFILKRLNTVSAFGINFWSKGGPSFDFFELHSFFHMSTLKILKIGAKS